MEKKLPGIFANKVDRKAGNNSDVYYGSKPKETVREEFNTKNIYQKINDIFNSPTYVYKADVVIKTSSGESVKQIVGKNSAHLITMENELIPITEIKDIYLK